MTVRSELIGIEHSLIARHPALAERHAEAVWGGREKIDALIERQGSRGRGGDSFEESIVIVQRAALRDYALRVRGVLPTADVAEWVRVRDSLHLNSRDAVLAEIDAPGAASLLDALEAVPSELSSLSDDQTLEQQLSGIADRCKCGYAKTQTVPKDLCLLCADAVVSAWKAEERRVLTRLPGLRAELDLIFDALVERFAQIELDPDGDMWSVAEHARKQAVRDLSRANRAARRDLVEGMLTTWQQLASVAVHDPRPIPRSVIKKWKRSGLGAARLGSIVVPGSAEVKAQIRTMGEGR